MAISKRKLAEAVAKFIEYKENGFTTDEIRAEILKDESAYKPAEIDQILTAIDAVEDTPGEQGDHSGNAPETPVISTSAGFNKDYDEYQVETNRENVYDELNKYIGTRIVGYTKLKKVRTTRVTEKIADEINSQSMNTNIRLYPVNS
jgi:hypothetical protein